MANPTRLHQVLDTLDLSAVVVSRHCDISNSLISRWRSGVRPLTTRSIASIELAATLAELDSDNRLDSLVEPLLPIARDKEQAIWMFITGHEIPNNEPNEAVQSEDEYHVLQHILLGWNGVEKTAISGLCQLEKLAPGQDILLYVGDTNHFWKENPTFHEKLCHKLTTAFQRNSRFSIAENCVETRGTCVKPALDFLKLNMKKSVQYGLYTGPEVFELILAVIPGHWSGRVERNELAEGGIFSVQSFDPYIVQRDEAIVRSYLRQSLPLGRRKPLESVGQNNCLRTPNWNTNRDTFLSIQELPVLGWMTQSELFGFASRAVSLHGLGPKPNQKKLLLDVFFSEYVESDACCSKIILSHGDLAYAVEKSFIVPALGAIAGSELIISPQLTRKQLFRILKTMRSNPKLEVALVPEQYFHSLDLEMFFARDLCRVLA